MRPDKIECLPGEFEPKSIHEIRGTIGLKCPRGYRKVLQQADLELQLLVGFSELPCSCRDAPVKFT